MNDYLVEGPAARIAGAVEVPGDKSIGHRAVMLSGVSRGRSVVRGLSRGEDNLRTVGVLAALGVAIREAGPGVLEIDGVGLSGLRAPAGVLDCGNSGTSIRLLAGLLAPQPFVCRLDGDQYLRKRPMLRVGAPLRQMGARVEGTAGKKPGEIYPPLEVGGGGRLHGITWTSEVASAQVKSAILLAGLSAEGPTTVIEPALSRDHTERMLTALGAPLRREGLAVTIDPRGWDGHLAAGERQVPGDLSSAAFLLGAALVVPGAEVTVRGVGVNPSRTGVLDALAAMGARIERSNQREVAGEPVADLTARHGGLKGVEIAGELSVRAIDELPLLAALAAHAEGVTTIRDAAELRVKESDRVAATVALLRALGAEAEERPDGLVVEGRGPGALRPGEIDSHGDHRIAMAGVIASLPLRGATRVADIHNVATSFTTFLETLTTLGAPLRLA